MLVTHGKKRNQVIYELQSKTNHSRESKCLKQFYAKFYLSPGQILNDQNSHSSDNRMVKKKQ